MTPEEKKTSVRALIHDAAVMLTGDSPDNVGREDDLEHVRRGINLANKILACNATEKEKASAAGVVHPQTRSLFGL